MKRGRPPKKPDQRKVEWVGFAVTEEEKIEIAKAARAADVSLTEYLRGRVGGGIKAEPGMLSRPKWKPKPQPAPRPPREPRPPKPPKPPSRKQIRAEAAKRFLSSRSSTSESARDLQDILDNI